MPHSDVICWKYDKEQLCRSPEKSFSKSDCAGLTCYIFDKSVD